MNPTAMAATIGGDTASPSTTKPIKAVRITSVFFRVIPTAKFRWAKRATTHIVASICAIPPETTKAQNRPSGRGSACPETVA